MQRDASEQPDQRRTPPPPEGAPSQAASSVVKSAPVGDRSLVPAGLDQTLADAARNDPDAWRRLVEAYTDRVFGLIVGQCGDRELAEEITQQTFVKLVRQLGKRDGYREQGRFESWLFRIAVNALRDEMRRRRRQARTLPIHEQDGDGRQDASADLWDTASNQLVGWGSESVQPIDELERVERIEALRRAMTKLPELDREVLSLRYTAELSFPQIAEALDQPLGTVLARAHRAVSKLKKILNDENE